MDAAASFSLTLEHQKALLSFLTSTPLLDRAALPSLTAAQLTQLMLASDYSLQSCELHLQALLSCRRRFPSVPDIVDAIRTARRDSSYVSPEERAEVNRYLQSEDCRLFPRSALPSSSPPSASADPSTSASVAVQPPSLREAGLLFDAAYQACSHNLSVLLGFCRRYSTAGVAFADTAQLCRCITAGVRPTVTLPHTVFHSILTFLYLPSTLSLFTSPPPLSSLSPSHPDLTSLLFEGDGLEGTKTALLRFLSLGRSFSSLSELWPAVHIQWRYGLSSTFEMRQALFQHLTVDCSGLLAGGSQQLGHAELECLLVAGRGLQRARAHCARLMAVKGGFASVQQLANAFFSSLSITGEEKRQVQALLAASAQRLFGLQAEAVMSSLTASHCCLLLFESGCSLPALQSHFSAFARLERSFASIFDLLSSLQAALLAQAYSPPFSLFSLFSFLLSSPGLLTPSLPLHSLSGKQCDAILSGLPINSVLSHLSSFHAMQRTFSSVSELASALRVAASSGLHSSPDMRRTLLSFLTSTECDLFDSVREDEELDGVLDVLLEASGSLPLCFHHLQQLQALQMRFTALVKVIPAIRAAVSTGAYSTRAMQTAVLGYLSSPECSLLSLAASTSLSSLPRATVDQLLLTGGGLLNTLKHLTRLNTAQQLLPSFSHLVSSLRIARRRRLYYSPAQRHALYSYITSPSCHFFDGCSHAVRVSERDMERLFKYGCGVEGSMRVLDELNRAAKRFKSFQHLCAIVKRISLYDARVSQQERERRRRREIGAQERQDIVSFLVSADCLLFSDHVQPLRVTAQEVDAVIAIAASSSAALQALRQLNDRGRRFLSMQDLTAAVAAMMGPHGLISLSHQQRVALISALSFPHTAIFSSESADMAVSEADLHSLVYTCGSTDRVLEELRAFGAVSRRFASFVEFRAGLQASVDSGLHSKDEERALLREILLTSSCHSLLGERKREHMRGDEREMEDVIIAARGFLAALYYLQHCHETLQRFDSLASLLSALSALAESHPVPAAFASVTRSSLSDRYHLFNLLSSPSSQLFADAADEADMLITPLAFDVFFSRCGGLQRAISVVIGLERMERRYMAFGEMIFAVCRVEDAGVGMQELVDYGLEDEPQDDDAAHSQQTQDDGDEEEEEAEDEDAEAEDERGEELQAGPDARAGEAAGMDGIALAQPVDGSSSSSDDSEAKDDGEEDESSSSEDGTSSADPAVVIVQ